MVKNEQEEKNEYNAYRKKLLQDSYNDTMHHMLS